MKFNEMLMKINEKKKKERKRKEIEKIKEDIKYCEVQLAYANEVERDYKMGRFPNSDYINYPSFIKNYRKSYTDKLNDLKAKLKELT